ncbi:o-succinylbenzoate synthase [uncultured Microbacterium sp.]|uniref:o-succinylbenzoate synthase n=1 Tax=uncultured Microbacterium sp. TaxID=191216 RepID=UPI0025D9FED3|nr:o-succinylbenzoate synthase [uncultured Microbacterium sp.]
MSTVALPSLDEILDSARVVSLPLAARFRGIETREALVFEGPEGWTEFSPFVEYADAEAVTWLAGAIDFGWRPSPPAVRDLVAVNATMPAVAASEVPRILARYDGCRTVKVKVAEPGQTLAADVARVRAVREVMGPEGRVRIDANGAWNVDEAERAVHSLAEFDLEYVEQPCAEVEELAELRERIGYLGIPIAADESVRKAADPLRVARAGAADLLVIKAQPLGGVHAARDLVAQAGLPAVVSSALDTSIGLSMGVALAASLPDLDYDCGLGTASLFTVDVVASPLAARGGVLPLARPRPSSSDLDRVAAADDRREWWMDRLRRCHAALEITRG